MKSRRRTRHRALVFLTGLVLLSLGLLGITTRTVMFPREDSAISADAIVVLGGLGSAAVVQKAIELAQAGHSEHILISDAFGGDTRPAHLCARPTPVPGTTITVDCFTPYPGNTRGEAEAIAAFATTQGWNRVIVVTSSYHVSRARVQVSRCYAGTLSVIGASQPMDPLKWAYQIMYQSAGFVKIWLTPDC
ncbi:YdcF family protein [Cryobacterium sp. PH29-G1]|uniref:YdcF family protein n=1 Tax=Cryobacterium sp. PH29-G1 TaxID=3046211 RepID=UPI0024B9EB0A|nr:YdcF family protein [Cryobacterium sp. PH29-G1]MDJ0347981.1 YdcF family protein [Cryobacterium sp. PH29-G1]